MQDDRTVREFAADLLDRLGLLCVAFGPIRPNRDADLLPGRSRIEEIDLFGVGEWIESARLEGVARRWSERFPGTRTVLAAVNGPYRIAYPAESTFVVHLTLWPRKWLTRVCPFVVNGFRQARAYCGKPPETLVGRRRPDEKELLDWHYGLENCRRYIRQESFDAPTWWIDGHCHEGGAVRHDISGPYRMTEFIAYTLRGALRNIGDFHGLFLPSADRAGALAAEFRGHAVGARNGRPVDPGWLAERKPEALSVIDRLIGELRAGR